MGQDETRCVDVDGKRFIGMWNLRNSTASNASEKHK
jgi:hypothetical protein